MNQIFLVLTVFVNLSVVFGQDVVAPADKQNEALRLLAKEIEEIEGAMEDLEEDRSASENEDDRSALAKEIEIKAARLDHLKADLISIVANVDISTGGGESEEPLTLSGEINSLLSPLIEEL